MLENVVNKTKHNLNGYMQIGGKSDMYGIKININEFPKVLIVSL